LLVAQAKAHSFQPPIFSLKPEGERSAAIMGAAAILLITLLLLPGGVAERLPAKQGNAGNALIQFHSSITKALSNASVAMRAQAGCASRGHCVVPAGETWVLDSSLDVETLTIKGTLTWDTSKDGLELRAGYVLVDGGHLQIGTRAAPMALRATVYIKDSSHRHETLELASWAASGAGGSTSTAGPSPRHGRSSAIQRRPVPLRSV